MKKIILRETFKPFSTSPGIIFPCPQTTEKIQFFPTALLISHDKEKEFLLTFTFPSPVLEIKTFYALLKNQFEVQLKLNEGICHYHLKKIKAHWVLEVKRCTIKASIKLPNATKSKSLKKGEIFSFIYGPEKKIQFQKYEILFFGCHKKTQLEKLYERKNLNEVLPFLFLLGQMREKSQFKTKLGPFAFFQDTQEFLKEKKHDQLLHPLFNLFKNFFTLGFMPHLEDIYKFGETRICTQLEESQRFDLLRRFYEITRLFFFNRKQNDLFFFSHLPPQLHCGKGVHFQEKDFHFSFEWSKKALKKMQFKPLIDQSYTFFFPRCLKSCRLQVDNKSYSVKNGQILDLEKNKTYFFDRFQK